MTTRDTDRNPAPHNRDGYSKSFYGPMSQPLLEAELKAEREAGPWYTVTVHGSPVEGSTDDKAEAKRWLARANGEDAFDGEATITTTDRPLAR